MNTATALIDFIGKCPTPYHVVTNSKDILKAAGFEELEFTAPWTIVPGGRYYSAPYGTTLFAFTISESISKATKPVLHIGAGHTDFPCLRIKPTAELSSKDYLKLNVESYGGLILNTWLDRPLSIAGKVSLKSEDPYHPRTAIIDFKKPLLTIPNLAIHLNREMNKGVELNKQTDMAPVMGMITDTLSKEDFFVNTLAKHLSVDKDAILDFDLYLYPTEIGCLVGINDEFISSPRLDNLTSVYALLYGITNGNLTSDNCLDIKVPNNTINMIALYDNEEIGRRSKQGADSLIANIVLNKIFKSLGFEDTAMYDAIMDGLLMSVDVSHAFHPNHENKNDPALICELTKGVALKFNSSQKYASDTEALAIAVALCSNNNIPYQKFANRSDTTGGGTLGSIASKWLPMKTIDLGVPLLAMHSARELMGTNDQEALNNLMKVFFN